MKYLIKQKVFSLKDKFDVIDESERVQFKVEGKMFSLKNKLTLMSPEGATLFYAERKLFTFMPEYRIYSPHGEELAIVKRKFKLFQQSYDVFEANNDIKVEGNFIGHSFQIHKNGSMAASIEKKWFSFGDTYMIDIQDEASSTLYLFIVIIIDQVAQASQKRSNVDFG